MFFLSTWTNNGLCAVRDGLFLASFAEFLPIIAVN